MSRHASFFPDDVTFRSRLLTIPDNVTSEAADQVAPLVPKMKPRVSFGAPPPPPPPAANSREARRQQAEMRINEVRTKVRKSVFVQPLPGGFPHTGNTPSSAKRNFGEAESKNQEMR